MIYEIIIAEIFGSHMPSRYLVTAEGVGVLSSRPSRGSKGLFLGRREVRHARSS